VLFLLGVVCRKTNTYREFQLSERAAEIVRAEFRKMLRKDMPADIDDIPISSLGIDSLDFFETMIHLEEAHGINIPIEKLDAAVTLRDLVKFLDD